MQKRDWDHGTFCYQCYHFIMMIKFALLQVDIGRIDARVMRTSFVKTTSPFCFICLQISIVTQSFSKVTLLPETAMSGWMHTRQMAIMVEGQISMFRELPSRQTKYPPTLDIKWGRSSKSLYYDDWISIIEYQ